MSVGPGSVESVTDLTQFSHSLSYTLFSFEATLIDLCFLLSVNSALVLFLPLVVITLKVVGIFSYVTVMKAACYNLSYYKKTKKFT